MSSGFTIPKRFACLNCGQLNCGGTCWPITPSWVITPTPQTPTPWIPTPQTPTPQTPTRPFCFKLYEHPNFYCRHRTGIGGWLCGDTNFPRSCVVTPTPPLPCNWCGSRYAHYPDCPYYPHKPPMTPTPMSPGAMTPGAATMTDVLSPPNVKSGGISTEQPTLTLVPSEF